MPPTLKVVSPALPSPTAASDASALLAAYNHATSALSPSEKRTLEASVFAGHRSPAKGAAALFASYLAASSSGKRRRAEESAEAAASFAFPAAKKERPTISIAEAVAAATAGSSPPPFFTAADDEFLAALKPALVSSRSSVVNKLWVAFGGPATRKFFQNILEEKRGTSRKGSTLLASVLSALGLPNSCAVASVDLSNHLDALKPFRSSRSTGEFTMAKALRFVDKVVGEWTGVCPTHVKIAKDGTYKSGTYKLYFGSDNTSLLWKSLK